MISSTCPVRMSTGAPNVWTGCGQQITAEFRNKVWFDEQARTLEFLREQGAAHTIVGASTRFYEHCAGGLAGHIHPPGPGAPTRQEPHGIWKIKAKAARTGELRLTDDELKELVSRRRALAQRAELV